MQYNFNEETDRTGTNCIKYDGRQMFFGKADVLPLWVADMDFKTPDFIIAAIKKRLDHEILGYTFRGDSYFQAICGWLKQRHNWDVRKEWISFSPGVVAGFSLAIEAFSEPGDEVVLQPPVYTPFFDSVNQTKRKRVENPLKIVNGRYTFDLDDLQRKITPRTKLLLLSNPHNPGGMVWTKEELTALAEICLAYKIFVISDEIHSDLIYEGHRHVPFAALSESAAANCVVCMAPSKTFNLAGMTTSFLVIADKERFDRYEKVLRTPHLHMGNIFGNVALEAAYTHGGEWLEQLLDYLQGNYLFLERFLKEKLPEVVPMKPEATYLVWLDFSSCRLSDKEIHRRLLDAGVGLNQGIQFGKQGSGYMRMNIGCTRATLAGALEKMAAAFTSGRPRPQAR